MMKTNRLILESKIEEDGGHKEMLILYPIVGERFKISNVTY